MFSIMIAIVVTIHCCNGARVSVKSIGGGYGSRIIETYRPYHGGYKPHQYQKISVIGGGGLGPSASVSSAATVSLPHPCPLKPLRYFQPGYGNGYCSYGCGSFVGESAAKKNTLNNRLYLKKALKQQQLKLAKPTCYESGGFKGYY